MFDIDTSTSEEYEFDIKPCPFCGSSASGWVNGKGAPHNGWWISVKCDVCTASVSGGLSYNTRRPFESTAYEKAVMRWNNRVNTEKGDN